MFSFISPIGVIKISKIVGNTMAVKDGNSSNRKKKNLYSKYLSQLLLAVGEGKGEKKKMR